MSWTRFPVGRLWSRRLTEPPRPCFLGERTPPPALGERLPFQGRLCVEACPKRLPPQRELSAVRLAEDTPYQLAFIPVAFIFLYSPIRTKNPMAFPPSDFSRSPSLQGRGGSVSRRDHNQFAEKRTHLAWALKSEGKTKPIPSYSSGGGPGEALLLEKRPPPEFSQPP